MLGTGVRGLMRRWTQGNQEPLMEKVRVGRHPGELGVIKSMDVSL